jgi:phage terminase small subunit
MAKMLTHKQRLFIRQYLNGMNGTEAAMSAYNVTSRKTATVIASENLTKPNIIQIINAWSPEGYILENSVRAIGEGLVATKGVKQLPDHRARLRAAAMGIKLLDEIYKS